MSMWLNGDHRRLRRALSLGACAVVVLVVSFDHGDPYSPDSIQALRELRQATPSSGAWNHPGAPQDYAILANPRAAGAIVFHARRPVCGALLPGAPPSAAARQVADVLLCESVEELVVRARTLAAAYMIVTRRDLEQLGALLSLAGRSAPETEPTHGSALAIRQLLVLTEIPGLELVRRAPSRSQVDGIADLAVWRSTTSVSAPEPASMRAR